MKTSIKAALITGVLGALATITSAYIGSNVGEKMLYNNYLIRLQQ